MKYEANLTWKYIVFLGLNEFAHRQHLQTLGYIESDLYSHHMSLQTLGHIESDLYSHHMSLPVSARSNMTCLHQQGSMNQQYLTHESPCIEQMCWTNVQYMVICHVIMLANYWDKGVSATHVWKCVSRICHEEAALTDSMYYIKDLETVPNYEYTSHIWKYPITYDMIVLVWILSEDTENSIIAIHHKHATFCAIHSTLVQTRI